jgi:hypothetical protein
VGYPTTLIICSVIACVTALGLNGTVDSASVTTILGGIVSGVLVGHYVKTTNGNVTTTTTEQGGATTTTTEHHAETPKGTL